MSEEEQLIVCLNYCVQDPETGHCLTCGRPPIPVSGIDLSPPKSFAGISLKGLSLTSGGKTPPDETS